MTEPKFAIMIHDLDSGAVYVAHKESDCKDGLHKSVYKTCWQLNDTITMGCVIGQFVKVG
jgi:hypothetical protein